jgi:glycosyltransferase involved in cell wall biosynthesis
MQGVQTESRHRGIGRYCLAVTRAFLPLSHPSHDTTLLFNAALGGVDEAIETLSDGKKVVRHRSVGPLRDISFDNRFNDSRREAAEYVFTHALNVREPDVVWLSSVVEGFLDDAYVPHARPDAFTVATLYDLIPLHDADYLGQARFRDWYMHRIEALKRCDLLLAISEWVRSDAIERLGVDPHRIVAIGAGVDPRFAPPEPGMDHSSHLRECFGIARPFVMYNGGFDKRKNVTALIEAYAALPKSLRATHVLVLVGRVDTVLRGQFAKTMASLQLRSDEVVFTGFVSDADLVRLYQTASVFAFPSELEGFGLAPLEAMACGAPAIVNNVTSLPEVVGNAEAMFDATQPGMLATLIEAVLTDGSLAARLRSGGLARASCFTWQAVAERALAAIESALTAAGRNEREAVAAPSLQLPLYRVDASNVATTLPALRQWPGGVAWSGPLPDAGPFSASDKYRLGGYARLLGPTTPTDWLALLEDEAIGFLRDRVGTDEQLREQLAPAQANHPAALQRFTEQAIAAKLGGSLCDDDLARIADAVVRAAPDRRSRWLVDVTHIGTDDLGTGVHRVVRSILREWLIHPPEDVRIEPIAFSEGRFYHAHTYACGLIGAAIPCEFPDDIVGITGDEVYIGLDWTMESLPYSSPLLHAWRRAGVSIHFVVYDLLPLTMPQAFHPHSRANFAGWMRMIADLGDVLHCISRTTAADVLRWLDANEAGSHPMVSSFELGADLNRQIEAGTLDPALESAFASTPSLLMVGTLEPRKGHEQVLDALELLWESGANAILVIVGRRGWLVREFVERVEQHRELNMRLFWLDDADDTTLEAIYRRATVLLAASRGEGYGLPLIEAAQRGKPVIARSLPVFREVVGDYPSYFSTDSAEGLATHIARWLVDRPISGTLPAWRTWKESANSLQHAIRQAIRSRST